MIAGVAYSWADDAEAAWVELWDRLPFSAQLLHVVFAPAPRFTPA
jgi:hypothetical protein